jgi:hypothetical protein
MAGFDRRHGAELVKHPLHLESTESIEAHASHRYICIEITARDLDQSEDFIVVCRVWGMLPRVRWTFRAGPCIRPVCNVHHIQLQHQALNVASICQYNPPVQRSCVRRIRWRRIVVKCLDTNVSIMLSSGACFGSRLTDPPRLTCRWDSESGTRLLECTGSCGVLPRTSSSSSSSEARRFFSFRFFWTLSVMRAATASIRAAMVEVGKVDGGWPPLVRSSKSEEVHLAGCIRLAGRFR